MRSMIQIQIIYWKIAFNWWVKLKFSKTAGNAEAVRKQKELKKDNI